MEILKAGFLRFANNCRWSWQGWRSAWATEATLRQWTVVNVISILLTFAVDMQPVERALIWALGILLLAAEMMNTGLEEMVDYFSTDDHPMAKKAKDCGSCAVALTAIAAAVAWVVVLVGA